MAGKTKRQLGQGGFMIYENVHTKFCKRCDNMFKGSKFSKICPNCVKRNVFKLRSIK